MNWSGFLSGVFLTVLGLILLVVGIVIDGEVVGNVISFVSGLLILGVGIYMLFNNDKEDQIEQIKKNKKRN